MISKKNIFLKLSNRTILLFLVLVLVLIFLSNSSIIHAIEHVHTDSCYSAEGNIVCDQVITSGELTAGDDQVIDIGEQPSFTGTVTYLDGHEENVTFNPSVIDETVYNIPQLIELTYGTYSMTGDNAEPYSLQSYLTLNGDYNFHVATEDENRGSVLGNSEKYLVGTEITVAAQPNDGFAFSGWYSNNELVSSNLEYTLIMPAMEYSLTAKFKEFTSVNVELNDTFHEMYSLEPYFNGMAYNIEEGIVLVEPMFNVYAVFDDSTIVELNVGEFNLLYNKIDRYGVNNIPVEVTLNNKTLVGTVSISGDSAKFSKFLDDLMKQYSVEPGDYAGLNQVIRDMHKQLLYYENAITEIIAIIELQGTSDVLEERLGQIYDEIARIYDQLKALEDALQEALDINLVGKEDYKKVTEIILDIREKIEEANALIISLNTQLELLNLSIEEQEALLVIVLEEIALEKQREAELNTIKEQLLKEIKYLEIILSSKEKIIVEKNSILDSTNRTIDQLNNQQAKTETVIAGRTEDLSSIIQEIENAKSTNQQIAETITLIKDNLKTLNSTNQELLKKKNELVTESNNIQSTINTIVDDSVESIVQKNIVERMLTLEELLKQLDKSNSILKAKTKAILKK